MNENNGLQTQIHQTERDTIEVVSYLKRQDQDKDSQVWWRKHNHHVHIFRVLQLERMNEQIKALKKEQRHEIEMITQDFQKQMLELDSALKQKNEEVEMLQKELKAVKEFRRKRAQMQKELDEVSKQNGCIMYI